MGSCLGCCVGSCLSRIASAICGEVNEKKGGTVPYLFLLFVGIILSIVFRYWVGELVVETYIYDVHLCGEKCMGIAAVYRISFALFAFFSSHMFLVKMKPSIHYHGWGWKILFFIIAFIASFLLPNEIFDYYSFICRFIGAFYLIIQIIIFIDFAYRWQEDWLSEEKDWKIPFLLCSLLFYVGSLVVCIFSFKWFTNGIDCGIHSFLIILTIIVTLLLTILSITSFSHEQGNILTSSIVTLYSYWLLVSAEMENPGSCNELKGDEIWQVVISIFLLALSICYSAYQISMQPEDEDPGKVVLISKTESSSVSKRDSKENNNEETERSSEIEKNEETDDVNSSNLFKFHLIMVFASMYSAMAVTGWESNKESSNVAVNMNTTQLWIKYSMQWLLFLLYLWSLLAPKIFPDRDF